VQQRKKFFMMRGGLLLCLLFPSILTAQPSPLSLSDALSVALSDNPTIRNACDAVGGAAYEVDIAESEFGFRLSPQATSGLGSDTETSQSTILSLSKKFATGTTVELASGTSATEKSFYRSFSGITVSQSLLRGFGPLLHTNNVVNAKRGITSASRQWELAKEQVGMDVITNFYRIIGQKLVLGVWERSWERAQKLLAASQAKMERGLTTKIDIFRAQTQAATAEASMLDAQEALQEAKDTLKILLGKEFAEELEVESQIIPAALKEGEAELVETALQRRVDLQEAADQVKDAQRNARIAERSLFPDLRIGFNYALTGRGNSFTDSTAFDNSRFRVLFSTSIPLNLGAERARSRQKKLEVLRKKREFAELQKRATQEVRQALRHVATVERRIAIQEKNVQATQANLELANLRFERGYADLFEVLRAEESLTQAQKEEITLRIEQVITALRLRRATGLLGPFLDTIVAGGMQQTTCPQPAEDSDLFE